LVDEQIRASKRRIDSSVRYYINEERGKILRGPRGGGLLASITSILQITRPTNLKPFACATRRILPSHMTAPRLRSAYLRRSNPLKLIKFGAAFVINSSLPTTFTKQFNRSEVSLFDRHRIFEDPQQCIIILYI
jgi:hypothetical protein